MHISTQHKAPISTSKRWLYLVGGIGIAILGLLIAILWKIFFSHTPAADLGITSTAFTWRDDSPLTLVESYYQAIRAGDSQHVRSAWETPHSRQARYAEQAVQNTPTPHCTPQQNAELLDTAPPSNQATVQLTLKCKKNSVENSYPVIFQLQANQTGTWKIVELRDAEPSP